MKEINIPHENMHYKNWAIIKNNKVTITKSLRITGRYIFVSLNLIVNHV